MNISDKIASLILNIYDKLDKKGKPDEKEWTVLSGFVVELNEHFEAVSVATGTKCLGASIICPQGITVNDSHAEILARRGFIKYILNQITLYKKTGTSYIISHQKNKFILKNGLKVHFYSSQIPCGDASIIDMPSEVIRQKRKITDISNPKKLKLDLYRTGAKPVPHSVIQDDKKDGLEYHKRGAVRTKPGRGPPTNSLSCSDKISRWIYTGVQGALVSNLIEGRINIDSIVIGGSQYDENIIKASLLGRSNCSGTNFYKTELDFIHNESSQRTKPCPKSLIWTLINNGLIEVGVEGRKLGFTKKNMKKSCLQISRKCLFEQLLNIDENFLNMTYKEMKLEAKEYQIISQEFKNKMGAWAVDKSENQNFKIDTQDDKNTKKL